VRVHPTARRHRRHVARWAFATGHSIDRDALAVIVAVRTDPTDGTVDTCWTTDDLEPLLMYSVGQWCAAHRAIVPDNLAITLSSYLRHLFTVRAEDASSDDLGPLIRQLAEHHPELRQNRWLPMPNQPLAPVVPIG
jgi:hypothetical protein